ncbi:MAG TPA: ABC transporter permease [Candidatus Limnocylindria bacterium]|jgi:putative ABC transport system permease protein|nr:ABC transporter permease [Candidatus Limnocylindria bacterium]
MFRWLNEMRENVNLALSAVRTHILRSSLTVLGILVGVFSIIAVMTAIRVLQQTLEHQMSDLGSHTFQLQKWPAIQVDGDADTWQKYARRKRFYVKDANRLREKADIAAAVSVTCDLDVGEASSRFAHTNPNIPLTGVTPDTFVTRNWTVADGRPIVDADDQAGRLVCILGADLAKTLFPFGSPVGEAVKHHGVNYQVIGVLEGKGAMFGQSQDNFMAVPLSTGLNRYGKMRQINIQVQAVDGSRYNETVEQVRGIMRAVRKVEPGQEDDFEIVSNDSLVGQFRSMTSGIRIGSAVISSIALVAAGIGIMNIMLVSVTERTREIGIRRAIGAKKRSVMVQFLCESTVLSQVGGILGILGGMLFGNVIAFATHSMPVIPWDWIGIGFGVCTIVGIVFGTYPAWKAANIDPIEALRYE